MKLSDLSISRNSFHLESLGNFHSSKIYLFNSLPYNATSNPVYSEFQIETNIKNERIRRFYFNALDCAKLQEYVRDMLDNEPSCRGGRRNFFPPCRMDGVSLRQRNGQEPSRQITLLRSESIEKSRILKTARKVYALVYMEMTS